MTSCSPRSGCTTWLRCAPDSASRRCARLLPPLLRQESITGKIAASTPCSQGEYYSFYDSRAPVSPRGLSMTWHDRKSRPPLLASSCGLLSSGCPASRVCPRRSGWCLGAISGCQRDSFGSCDGGRTVEILKTMEVEPSPEFRDQDVGDEVEVSGTARRVPHGGRSEMRWGRELTSPRRRRPAIPRRSRRRWSRPYYTPR